MAHHLNLTARKYKMTIFSTITKSKAVLRNHIQKVQIEINDKIMAQVTDFIYLVFHISEYKSNLEDKLQLYNKMNGVLRRHFVKQMKIETKLSIPSITAKAALKFGSGYRIMKKREEKRLEAAEMKFLDIFVE
jgi:hypothetical protein